MKTAQTLWATHPTASLSSWGKRFSLYPTGTPFLSAYACCLSSSFHAPLCRVWLHLLDASLWVPGGAAQPTRSCPCPGLDVPTSLRLSSEGKRSNSPPSWWPSAELAHGYESLPGTGDPNLLPLSSKIAPLDGANTREMENYSSVPSSFCEASSQATSQCP